MSEPFSCYFKSDLLTSEYNCEKRDVVFPYYAFSIDCRVTVSLKSKIGKPKKIFI